MREGETLRACSDKNWKLYNKIGGNTGGGCLHIYGEAADKLQYEKFPDSKPSRGYAEIDGEDKGV